MPQPRQKDWMFVLPQNSQGEILNPNVRASGSGALGVIKS